MPYHVVRDVQQHAYSKQQRVLVINGTLRAYSVIKVHVSIYHIFHSIAKARRRNFLGRIFFSENSEKKSCDVREREDSTSNVLRPLRNLSI